MAEVNLMIDGRNYGIACDDGQEQRVKQLGKYVDDRLRQLTGGNSSSKAQSMVLTSLLLADEVFDLSDRLEKSGAQPAPAASNETYITYQGLPPQDEQNITNLIGMMADKVERLTSRAKKRA